MVDVLLSFAFISFRSFGFFLLFPPGAQLLSYSLRLFLGLLCGVAFIEIIPPAQGLEWSWLIAVSELLLGVCLGIPSALVIQIAKMGGELIDIGRGAQMAQSYDPFSESGSSLTASFLSSFATTCLLTVGLLPVLVVYLQSSFLHFPPGSGIGDVWETLSADLLTYVSMVLQWSFIVFTPLCFVFLVVDTLIALIAKSLTNGVFYAEAFVIKSVATYALMLLLLSQGLHLVLLELCRRSMEGLFYWWSFPIS